MSELVRLESPPEEELVRDGERYQLKELKNHHRQVLSLVAQGLKNVQVAEICNITPEYITMLLRMPICREYLQKMNEAAAVQLDAMFTQTVETIQEAQVSGNTTEKLKAARLQLEATGRIGSKSGQPLTPSGNDDRLERLSHRLITLLEKQQTASGRIFDEDATVQPISTIEGNNSGEQAEGCLDKAEEDVSDGDGPEGSEEG